MSESFEKLQNRILSDARVKAEETEKQAGENARQMLDEGKAKAQKEADELVAKADIEAEALRRSILSAKVRSNRLRLLEEKNQIVGSVMLSVKEKLTEIAAADEFQDALKRLVSEAIEAVGAEKSTVKVGFRGVSKGQVDFIGGLVPKGVRLVVEDKPLEELGGVVATDQDGKIVYNNSFRARLDRLDNQLLTLISSTIFGE